MGSRVKSIAELSVFKTDWATSTASSIKRGPPKTDPSKINSLGA